MDMVGKTLVTIGAAWLCVSINGLANVLFAGWSLIDIGFLSLLGFALVVIGTKIAKLFDLCKS